MKHPKVMKCFCCIIIVNLFFFIDSDIILSRSPMSVLICCNSFCYCTKIRIAFYNFLQLYIFKWDFLQINNPGYYCNLKFIVPTITHKNPISRLTFFSDTILCQPFFWSYQTKWDRSCRKCLTIIQICCHSFTAFGPTSRLQPKYE